MLDGNGYDILIVDTLIGESLKVIRSFESSTNILNMINTMVIEF